MTGIDVDGLLTIIGAVILIAGGYGSVIGPFQMEIAEAVFTWHGTPSERKPVYNFAIGVALATILTAAAALYVDDWRLLAVGLVAGLFASTEAAKRHDAETAEADAYDAGRADERELLVQRRRVTTPGPREG